MKTQKMLWNNSLLLLLLIPFSTSRDNITPTLPIKVGESLLSKEKNFELGFFNSANSTNWYLGIRYSKISEKAIVWVVNRDNPINDTSTILTINRNGNLVLYGHNNSDIPIWSTKISSVQTNHNISA